MTLEAAVRLFDGIPEPAHGEDHLVYTRTLCYAIAHFEWNEAWRPFFHERALDVLCSVFPEAEDKTHGWRIEKREWGVGHQLAWSTGRELRDTSEPFEVMCGKGFWRFVRRSSELATQIVSQFHEQTHHMPPDAVLHQLEEVGVKIPKVDSMIKQASAGCSVCHRNKVTLGHVSRLMKRDESGPIDLATVAHLNEATPSAYWVCDTAGPLKVRCESGKDCFAERHVVIFVQIYFRRVLLFLVPDLTVQSMVETMVALTSTEGRIDLLITDPGSQFQALSNEFGPIEGKDDKGNLKILESLSKRVGKNIWLDLLIHRYSSGVGSNSGVRFRVSVKGQSHLQGLAEKVVEKVKLYFADEKVFKVYGKGTLTDHDVRLRLSLLMHNINSIPFHTINPGVRFSPNDLLGASGRIAVNLNYPDMYNGNFGRKPSSKVKDALGCMERLNMRVRLDVFRFFLPLLRDNSVRLGKDRGRKGTGDSACIGDLTRGSIVVDLDKVRVTHSLRGSIARVELLTEGNRGAIISSVRQKSLRNLSADIRKQLRSCQEHKERGCQICIPEIIAKSPGKFDLDVRARASDQLYLIHREPLPEEEVLRVGEGEKDSRWLVPKAGREDEPHLEGQFTFPLSEKVLKGFIDDEKFGKVVDEKRENRYFTRNQARERGKKNRKLVHEFKNLKYGNKIAAISEVVDESGQEKLVKEIKPSDDLKTDILLRRGARDRKQTEKLQINHDTRTCKVLGINILNIPSWQE